MTQGTITPSANGNRFGGSGWFNTGNTAAGNTLAEAVAGNDYIQFVVTPNSGFSFTPTSFVFSWDRSSTGPSSVTLRSSADSFTANLGTVTGIASGGVFTVNTITISGLSNLTAATTFRLYGYGSTATSGTGGFDIGASTNNVVLNGTTASTALDITTSNSMPNGAVGTPYTTSFASSGGTAPYTYAVTAGAAPTGLTLNSNGTWTGSPTIAGTFNFDVTVTDSNPFAFVNATEIKNPFQSFAPNTKTESFTIIVPAAPTAASATVRGRVVNEFGRGLSRTSVSVLNTQSGETTYARANQFGYFTLANLPVGDFYIMQVQRKGYNFPASNSFQLFEDLEGLTITGTPNQ